jgi:hypothetical protein
MFAFACSDQQSLTGPATEYEPALSSAGQPVLVTICHKFGTPAQMTLTVPLTGATGHVTAHGDFFGGCGARIIDADGSVSPGRGLPAFIDPGLVVGMTLSSWPTGFHVEGIDWFDNDGSCTWTFGDDLHVEGPAHSTASRNALHDSNPPIVDPVVLDLDGSFFDGQQVDVDLETGSAFTGCPGVDPLLMFHDADGNTFWDNGEDIVLDLDSDGIFNSPSWRPSDACREIDGGGSPGAAPPTSGQVPRAHVGVQRCVSGACQPPPR